MACTHTQWQSATKHTPRLLVQSTQSLENKGSNVFPDQNAAVCRCRQRKRQDPCAALACSLGAATMCRRCIPSPLKRLRCVSITMFVRGAPHACLRSPRAVRIFFFWLFLVFSCFGQVGFVPFALGVGGVLWVAGMHPSNPVAPSAFAVLIVECAASASVGTHHLVTVCCGKSWVEVWPAMATST